MVVFLDERPFPSARARNEIYIKITNAIYLCEEMEDLELLQKEYETEIKNIKKFDDLTPNSPAPVHELLLQEIETQQQTIKEKNIW